MEGLRGNVKICNKLCIVFSALYAYFHINDDAKKCRYLSSQIILHSLIIHLNCSHMKYCKKSALLWIH